MIKIKTILLVDDNKAFIELLSSILRRDSLKIITAYCQDEALDKIKNLQFDLIISDYDLGNGNGLSILEYLREHNINTKFIMLTGIDNSELKEQVIKLKGIFLDKGSFELLKTIQNEIVEYY